MTLKNCQCGLKVTTKNAIKIVRDDGLGLPVIWFTCPDCKSTMIIKSRPKTRLANFHELRNHPMMGRDYKRLSKTDLAMCVEFITARESLDSNAYAKDCNRWFLDTPDKPKRHSLMWALVLQSNGDSK